MKYKEVFRMTTNISPARTNKRQGVVFHHTGGSFEGAVSWLRDPASGVSAHVVIAKNGERAILAADDMVTWHAGAGRWRGENPNHIALGVEFELTEADVRAGALLTSDQLKSMTEWLVPRWRMYNWTMDDMTHHREVDPGRKIDLSPNNWRLVRNAIASAIPQNLYRVFVEGKQIGSFINPMIAVQNAITSGAKNVQIKLI